VDPVATSLHGEARCCGVLDSRLRGNDENERRTAEAGFTLLELMIALGVLAVAAAVAMPLLHRPAGDAALMATARQIVSFMRVARAAAIRDNADRLLTLDLERRRFWVDGITAPTPIARGIAVDLGTLEKELVSGGQGGMRFHPDGSASGGQVMLTAAGRRVTIELDWMTGHANIRRGP
jgi:general secretion pathway protein H